MLDKIFKLEHQKLLSLVTSTAEHSLTEIIEQYKDFHFIGKYLSAENEWLVYKYEIEKGIFLDDFEESDKLETIKEIAHSKKYLHFEIEDLMNTIIALKINFLVRPNFTLEKFIFGNELTRIFSELFIKLKYFDFYDYLINGISETFHDIKNDNGAAYLTVTDFKSVSKNYDESYISELTPEQFSEIIKPLFELFTDNGFDGISPKALKIFLEDKNLFEAGQQLLQIAEGKNLDYINEKDFIGIIEQIFDKFENPEDDFDLPPIEISNAETIENIEISDENDSPDIDEDFDSDTELIEDATPAAEIEDATPASIIAKKFVATSFTEDIPEIDEELIAGIEDTDEFEVLFGQEFESEGVNTELPDDESTEELTEDFEIDEEATDSLEDFEIDEEATDSLEDFEIDEEATDSLEDFEIDEVVNDDADTANNDEDFEHDALVPDVNEDNAEATSNLVLDELDQDDADTAEITDDAIPEEEFIPEDFTNVPDDINSLIEEFATPEEATEDITTDILTEDEMPFEETLPEENAAEEIIPDTEETTDNNDFNEDEFDLDAFANSILSGESDTESTPISEISKSVPIADNSEITSLIDSIRSKINSNPSKSQHTKDASETKSQLSSILGTFKSDETEEQHDDFYSASYSDDILNDLN